ncbi:MAG: hypothetical protein JSW34_04595 [Candidatus Zixiibacteriota bacterium]|nr:MAG: hypothetical protein JSW34_04595 [candidate division Zixibacteria bacterium]
MRVVFLLIFGAGLALVLTTGCGDDDCPNCPQDVDTVTVQKLRATGQVRQAYGNLYFEGSVRGPVNTVPEVDSVKIDGDKVDMELVVDRYSTSDIFWDLNYFAAESGLSSGDSVDVSVYTPFGVGICRVEVLDRDDDAVSFVDWQTSPPYDTVDAGSEIEVAWNHVERADWYLYLLSSLNDQFMVRDEVHGYQTDTILTISAEDNALGGNWVIAVSAMSGPYPEDGEGNFMENDVVDGSICGCSNSILFIVVRAEE